MSAVDRRMRTINSRWVRRTCRGVAGLLGGWLVASVAAADRPNIVFILADDLGWSDVGFQGSRYYETPHLDRLAKEGMRFTHGYTTGPNCQPTRAALMTGQYGPRTGVYTVGDTNRFDWSMRPLVPVRNVTKLAPAKVTVAEALRDAGYVTGMFGKWHLGIDADHHPNRQGFEETIESSGAHFNFKTHPPVEVPAGAYLADWLTDRAVDFVQRHRERPFFLYLAHFAVHSPHDAKPEGVARFRDRAGVGGQRSPVYAAMIASLDESVGRVVQVLDDHELSSRTLVIFSSDNGGVGGYVEAGIKTKEGITSNAPLRGGKGMLYEGGVRVPWVFRWPGRIAAGVLCEEPVISVDLFPTLVEFAGGRLPAEQPLDGVSLVPLLVGQSRSLHREALYWHFPGYLGSGPNVWRTTPVSAIRVGDFKLLEFLEDGRTELYNLRQDVGQQRDLVATQPEEVKRLQAKLKSWREGIGAPMPTRRGTPP